MFQGLPNQSTDDSVNRIDSDSPSRSNCRPKSVYVHVPFCRHRCGYCNFTLVAGRDYLVERYLAAIATEIQILDDRYELDTLYLGGGTPSRLNGDQLNQLRAILDTRFQLGPAAEFTVECNPADMDASKAKTLASIGVNRISLGVQSMEPGKLKRLERDHDAKVICKAVEHCRSFCQSLSIDLIFATETETPAHWQADLEAALELEPDHISTYELTIEKGTAFWNRRQRGEIVEPDEEVKSRMYEWTIDRLSKAGLPHYEISSFSKPIHQSRHNSVYWTGRDYFAFGPGASSYLGGVRATNHRSPLAYLKRIEAGESPVAEQETLLPRDRAVEHLVTGLRMRAGLNVRLFEEQNGFDPVDLIENAREELEELGFLSLDDGWIRVTDRGVFFCDWIAEQILGDPSKR